MSFKKHLIIETASVKVALEMLNSLGSDAILFVVDDGNKLIGSLTDGDLRRGFLKSFDFNNNLKDFLQANPKFIRQNNLKNKEIAEYRNLGLKILPVINLEFIIVDVINLSQINEILPLNVFILAGGKGQRLMPLTNNTPKPMLIVGEKPILEHNIDRLVKFGIKNFHISVNYLSEKIIHYFKNGENKNIDISYVEESFPMGTLGSIKLVDNFSHDVILIMNSDILTTLDYSAFYNEFIEKNADISVACIPYNIDIPYAVLEINEDNIIGIKEKPTYTYYSNAGIYLVKKSIIQKHVKKEFFNATDLIDLLITNTNKVIYFPIYDYWLDIGRLDDFNKAQIDIKHLKL